MTPNDKTTAEIACLRFFFRLPAAHRDSKSEAA
jgi:hypothetical protein